jgi:hypothetical protein
MDFIYAYWTVESTRLEALKYNTRTEFIENSIGAYEAAVRFDVLNEACSHMKLSRTSSVQEINLFNIIKNKFQTTQKLRDVAVKIDNKPHIRRFEIDIYVPELGKGIEFDGTFYHSFDGLKRSRPKWPEEDVENYHKIKDDYFRSKGIEILHINEVDWIKDKEACVKKCLDFLKS